MVPHLKRLVHRALDKRSAKTAERKFSRLRQNLLVLCYHRILPRGFGEMGIVEPGMYVYEDTFRRHLELLDLHFELVDLADWIDRRAAGRTLPARAAAITFDDGWQDNYAYAFPILTTLQIPATIFVVSALAGSEHSFWPERLARRLQSISGKTTCGSCWLETLIRDAGVGPGKLVDEAISRVIATAKRDSDTVIHAELDKLDIALGALKPAFGRDLASWAELREMADSGLVAIGSHTRHHVRMRDDLAAEVLHEEIIGSRQDIVVHCGQSARLFCFPNGDTTPSCESLVRQSYVGACTTVTGWNDQDTDSHAIRRISLHEDRSSTDDAFLARLVSAL